MRKLAVGGGILGLAVLVALGCGGSTGGGGGGGLAVANQLANGGYKAGELGADLAPSLAPWGVIWAIQCDGAGTALLDDDLDGLFDNGSFGYTAYADGTFTVSDGSGGIISPDSEVMVATDTNSADFDVDIWAALRLTFGVDATDFTGDYVACKMEVNTADDTRRTSLISYVAAGAGTVDYDVLQDSVAAGANGTYNYTVNNSELTLTETGEDGVLKSDGEIFIVTDNDSGDDTNALTVGIKKSSGNDNTLLSGQYIVVVLNTTDDGTITYWTQRLVFTFDGDVASPGTGTYLCLAGPGAGGGAPILYDVSPDGTLSLPGIGMGIVSADGNVFISTDYDDGDDLVNIIIGVKKIQ